MSMMSRNNLSLFTGIDINLRDGVGCLDCLMFVVNQGIFTTFVKTKRFSSSRNEVQTAR
jgi:hypothetical protein